VVIVHPRHGVSSRIGFSARSSSDYLMDFRSRKGQTVPQGERRHDNHQNPFT
jgi:outer membrane usher protein FimD/PapC